MTSASIAQAILEHYEHALLVVDPASLLIVEASPLACQTLGYSREELLQLPVSGYIFCAGSALAHNLGQLAGAAVLLSSAMALGYAPVLLAAGLIVGGISCILSRALFAALPKQDGQQRRGSPFQK